MRWTVALALCACRGGGDGKPAPAKGSAASQFEIVKDVVLPDGGVAQVAGDEVEPNDGEDVATPIALGATVRGKLDADGDVDFYKLEVDKAGALAIELTAIDGYDLSLEIEDASGTVLAKSDRPGARVKEGVPNLGVAPGKYLAIVRGKKLVAAAPKPRKLKRGEKAPPAAPAVPSGPSPVYELTARVAQPTGNAEREPDDDRGTALDLIVGDPASGFVGWTGDADVWKLDVEALSAKNAIDIELTAVDGTQLQLDVADGIGAPLISRKAPRGAPLIVRNLAPVVPAGAPPYHYLTVRGDRSNPDTAYQVVVKAHALVPDGETEPNDTPEHAMAMPADRTTLHGTWTPGDTDCFALPVADAARTVEATVDPKDLDLGLDLIIDGKVAAKSDHPGAGAAEKVSGNVPAGKKAVFRVRGTDGSGEGSYDIQVQDGTP